MTSQISQFGDQALVNTLSGAQTLTAGPSLSTWKPGDVFYNTGTAAFQNWNGSAWAVGVPTTRYIALLTADPVAGNAVNMSDAGFVECSTAGYNRSTQGQVTFSNSSAAYPSSTANTNVLTFTMSATMLVAVQWAALVTVASGTAGIFLASWQLAQGYLVSTSQSIQVGIGQLTLQGN